MPGPLQSALRRGPSATAIVQHVCRAAKRALPSGPRIMDHFLGVATMRTSFGVNDMTIHRIVEQEAGFTPILEFLPSLSKELLDENRSWVVPAALDPAGMAVLCFQSYVVKTPHHTILVDACIGNDKSFPHRSTW